MDNKYENIIKLPHHVSPSRKKMELEARAAQFTPYAALVGFGDVVSETARTTERQIIPDEHVVERLNRILVFLSMREEKTAANFTFFIKDDKKDGGKYVTETKTVKSIDEILCAVIFTDNTAVQIEDIIDIKPL